MNSMSAPIYNDFQGLANLKAQAVNNSSAAVDEVARQFESLFLQMMVKSMRDASLGDGLMESDQSLFYRDMFDQQLTLHLAENRGVGLADVIKQQLGGGDDRGADASHARGVDDYRRQAVVLQQQLKSITVSSANDEVAVPKTTVSNESATQLDPGRWEKHEFVQNLWPMAQRAAAVLGLQPQALIAQAALESGWGKHMMQFSNGQLANNLFGIKADQRWEGKKVSVDSLEYEQGVALKKRSHFRAYDSLGDSFDDYAEFIKSNPRYRIALEKAGDTTAYFDELQRAGYATDPNYASKIDQILSGSTLKHALSDMGSPQANLF